jgi:RNA polymerase subunit RPABC4/transcription elongation factor Spt4
LELTMTVIGHPIYKSCRRNTTMSTRVCDKCGKEKDISHGATCEKGHFLCRECKYHYSGDKRKSCPICEKPLR